MGTKSNIQWTDLTWNIARGCTKVDEDCKYCYMYRESLDSTRYNPLEIKRTKTVFDLPLKIKEPSKVFTCSLTDFFHEAIDGYRAEAWDIIRKCPQHTFQILTKRPERILENLPEFWDEIRGRVWLGTSVGSNAGYPRINDLIRLRQFADVLFISFEPLHGPIYFHPETDRNIELIDWVIIGGESGNEVGKYRYRPCQVEWMESLVDRFKPTASIFVKQMGTYLSKQLKMSDRHGSKIQEFPEYLQLREFPI